MRPNELPWAPLLIGAALGASATWLVGEWPRRHTIPDRCPLLRRVLSGVLGAQSLARTSRIFKPPLPQCVVDLLTASGLCYLSTSNERHAGGQDTTHLSLMKFTYHQADEKIIISTRRTRKLENILANPRVAVLIHDFPDQCGGADQAQTSRTYSVTLYGVCVVETAAAAETYRQIHLANNPGYAQFIKGDDIIIVTIAVESAAICNIDDEVQYWDVLKGLRSTK